MKRIVKTSLVVVAMMTLGAVNPAAQQHPDIPGQTVSGYILGPDDEISIRGIESSDKSERPYLIGTNGNITLPLIGRVKAGGQSVEQLEGELTTRYKEFIQDPQISVTVTVFGSQPVSVIGAIGRPGVYQLRGPKTLSDVLSMAGGASQNAGSTLTISRHRENGEIPLTGAAADSTGRFSVVDLNMQKVLEAKDPAMNIEIKPNDLISISEASTNKVYVVGDVLRAGAFPLGDQKNISVLRAVAEAGGLGRTSKPQHARIIREVPGDKKLTEIAVNIKLILSGKADDFKLLPNDVLVVPTSGGKVFIYDFLPSTYNAAVNAAIYHF